MIGVTIRDNIGIGDKVQFSSLPENYFRATGQKLVDVSRAWIFDHNPFVVRGVTPEKAVELWNFPKKWEWPRPRAAVYQSNAEIWSRLFGATPALIRPRLYRYEDFPYHEREMILFQTHGKSHGTMPDYVIEHVLKKYGPTKRLYHVGLPSDPDYGIPKIKTPTLWDLVAVISRAQMLIGPDSGPAWIAACYPDVLVKKVRLRNVHGYKPFDEWVPLEIDNIHSHWDDRAFMVYNKFEDDIGFTMTYRKL